jgi:hypothetical protein
MQPPFYPTFFKITFNKGAGIPTGCGLDGRSSIPGRGKTFSLASGQDSGAHPASYPMGTGGALSPRVSRPGLEADQSDLVLKSRMLEL